MFNIAIHPCDLDIHIRNRLASSLSHITTRNTYLLDSNKLDFDDLLTRIRSHKLSPYVFGRYFDLVIAINNNEVEQAKTLFGELAFFSQREHGFRIIRYSKEELGAEFETMPRLVFASYSSQSPIASAEPLLYEAIFSKTKLAINIIHNVDPEIGEEINEIINEVYIGVNNIEGREFGGASSLIFWGAIIMNANYYFTTSHIVEFFVHEITHKILLGYNAMERLVLNNPSELHSSPLRNDSRPVDGIFHATLVCARIALFIDRWRCNGHVTDCDEDWAKDSIVKNITSFNDGLSTVRKYGEITDTANEMLNEAEIHIQTIA